MAGELTLWEARPWADDRARRRLVLAFDDATDAHQVASVWAWSNGDPAIPPLARYLLHAAKLRQLHRDWQRDDETHELTAGVRAQVARLRQAPPEQLGDAAVADGLHRRAGEARLKAADLRELRKAVEIAGHNMGLVVSSAELLAAQGPLADDKNLAAWFLDRLDDEVCYLDIAADRAADATEFLVMDARRQAATASLPTRTATALGAGAGPGVASAPDDIARNVFVVHGRDAEASTALWGFLAALGLTPLDWETLVAATGSAAPYLRDVIVAGIAMAQAAVVLLTPDDVVWLHPSLHGQHEEDFETRPTMQARPNVILELGMALATYADRTIVLLAGQHRPMADLGGTNYIRLNDSDECLEKIMRRLQTASCVVSDDAPDLRARAWFSDLAAYSRVPPP